MYSQNIHLNKQLKIWLISLLSLIILIILVGGLTRLTDSGLSITTWELFVGLIPPLTDEKWLIYFELYKKIPEYSEQNFNMTLEEFKIIFWWEWGHRQLGRLIGLVVLFPMIYFSIKHGLWILKKYGIILFLVCLQGLIGWYMVSSGLIERVDVSHYRLSLHLVTAFIILSIVFWRFLELTNLKINQVSIRLFSIKFFLFLIFIQLIIGAFVSGMDAGKVYNTWPLMGSSYFPDDSKIIEFLNSKVFDNPSIVQFIHRNLAYLILAVYLYIFYFIFTLGNKRLLKPIIFIGLVLLAGFFRNNYNLIWCKNSLCIITPDKFNINSSFNFIFSLYFRI